MFKKFVANSWLTEPRFDDQNTVGETLCQREHADECDINVQIKRFQALGLSPHRPLSHEEVSDLSDLNFDFIAAHNVIQEAREVFDGLDDRVKQRFHGSPALFLEFMSDLSHNYDEALDLGLIEPKVSRSESPAEPVPPQAAAKAPQGPRKAPQGPEGGSGGDAQGSGA